ncbi:MAG: transposase [Planctomycetaceae bacterium]|nr:transposase [Planctomycetaceae bacterium]
MEPVRLGVGTEWLLDGRTFRVVRQISNDLFVAEDIKFRIPRQFTRSDILTSYADGTLSFSAVDPIVNEAQGNVGSPVVHDLTEQQQAVLRDRWSAIAPLADSDRQPTQDEFRERAAQLTVGGVRCSPRTLRRWWRAWHQAGKNRLALLPRTMRSGARGKRRRHGWLEKYPRLKQLADDAIQNVYLTKARRPISAVTRRVLEDLQRLNARMPAAQALPVPKETTLNRAIARRIAQLDPWEVDRQRWGRQIADRRHSPTSPQHLARRILERVEVDHTPLKVVVGTQAGPIGQPTLTVLIDYCSRMILGFCLSFEPPSFACLMEALRHAILPKTYIRERYSTVRGTWPCYGVPEKLVCDRGADLTSKDLENAAFQLGMELDFNPPRTPHFKGAVEAFFGGLNDQLSSTLPGRTFRSWEQRADYNPDDGPFVTYEALLEIIHVHLVDVYAASKHPTSGQTRLSMWQESAEEFPPSLPASPDDLVILLSKQAERTLSARGVELGGMFYTSDELMAVRAELAATNIHTHRMCVRYNPWDLGYVWVLHPVTKGYIKALAVDAAMNHLTQYQWNVLKRAVRDKFDEPDHMMNLAAGRNAIREIAERAMTKPSRKRRQRAARFLQAAPGDSTSAAAESDDEPLLDEAVPSQVEPVDNGVTDVNPDDLDVDDWGITTA